MTAPRRFTRCTLEARAEVYERAVALLLELPLSGWQEEEGTLTFWLPRGLEVEQPVAAQLDRLRELGRLWCEAEPGGWEERWRRFHHAATVGDLVARPPWVPSDPSKLDVVIDIGMAFGTGAHVTTRQCLAIMQELPRGSLLDVGTGSGILALAALRLGFAPVYGIDYDEDALDQAARNARLNGLSPSFVLADVRDEEAPLPAVDVAVANLALKPIVALGRRYERAVAAGRPLATHVLLAGLLETQVDEALNAFPSFAVRRREQEGEWVLLHLEAA
jgi:ribosomal protein L11 methyltransferase